MLLKEVTGHIKAILSRGGASDDFEYSDRHIYFILKYVRAELIKNKANKMYLLSGFNYQTISCLSLELVNIHDCNCLPEEVGCKFRRTSQPLPEILTSRNNYLIDNVTDMMGNTISETTYVESKYDKYTFIRKDLVQYFIHNGKLYITNNTNLEKINITAIFFDPLETNGLSSCDTTDCYNVDTMDFPMEKDLMSALFTMTYQEIVNVSMRVPKDVESNAKGAEESES